MPRRCAAAFLTIILWLTSLGEEAIAQQGVLLNAAALFYGDNTEFRNPFREGETLFGAAARLDAEIEMTGAVSFTIGVFGNHRFGSERALDLVRPVLALTVSGRRSRFVFGTLQTPRAGSPAGPDRTGPHGLLPPLQRESLAFERPYEAGLQWRFAGDGHDHDAWVHWQRLNTAAHRERLDAGVRATWMIQRLVSIPIQTHVVHEGGQLFASGPVRDSFALASGIVLSNNAKPSSIPPRGNITGAGPIVQLELLGAWSRYTPDREASDPTRDGGGFFGRLSLEQRGWRTHLIMWRGDDFIKDEGDSNYLSMRRDGTRYRGVRDYAEAGVTRTFTLAAGTLIEASFRIHRVERHYEYSYRVLGVVRARARLE